jgi:hypothetical protein
VTSVDQRFVLVAFGVLAALVLAIGGLLIVEPQLSKASSVTHQIGAAQSRYQALHANPSSVGGPSHDATPVFELARAMPTTDDMPDALVELARLARASSATLVSVRPGAVTALSSGASALPIQMTVDGSWTQVTSFLARVRNEVRASRAGYRVDGRLFDVDQVSISPGAVSGIEAVLAVNAFEYAPVSSSSTDTTSTDTTSTDTTTTTASPSSAQALGSTGGSN